MSVINQMLKDLDKRQGEQSIETSTVIPSATKASNMKWLLLAVLVIVIINIAGIFAWQLYTENQQFKNQALQSSVNIPSTKGEIINNKLDGAEESGNEQKAGRTIVGAIESSFAVKSVAANLQKNFDASQQALENESAKTSSIASSEQSLNDGATRPGVARRLGNVADKADNLSLENSLQQKVTVLAKKTVAEPVQVIEKSKPQLSISRTQLSPQALAEKKITEAEQSMEVNELSKAESLFEEVLLLLPSHETARKQLAALWYGKKAYQDAINLLSQGIALAPQAEEMRLMSARIYFEQGQAQRALDILSPVSDSQNIELQALFANVAAQLNDYQSAILAYKKLLTLEPNVGRWWLGLAVSLDSQGQFKEASNAYNQAIVTGNLSSNTMQFARQRLSELGE